MHVTGDRNVVRYQIRLNQIVGIIRVGAIRNNIIVCRVGDFYSVIAAIRNIKAVLAVSLGGHIPLAARARNSNSCTLYRMTVNIGNRTSDDGITRLNCGFDGRNLGGILGRNDLYFIFASLKVGKFIVASFIRLYSCDELMLVIVQIYGSAYIRVATLVLSVASDLVGTNSGAYRSGQLVVGFYAVAAIVQLHKLIITVLVRGGSLDNIPLFGFRVILKQLSRCTFYCFAIRSVNIAVDSIRVCLRYRRLIFNSGQLNNQLNGGCLGDGYGLGIRSAVANRCNEIVLAAGNLKSCLARSVGLYVTIACTGVRYGCIINRIVVGINYNNLYLVREGYSQHDVGLVLAIKMDSGLAVSLVAVAILAFNDCGQIVSAVRQVREAELAMIVSRGFEGLGLIVTILDSYNCVCQTIALVVGYNTRSGAVTRRDIRTRRLESQILSGIALNIDSNSIRLLACCGCVQAVLTKQISVQHDLVLAVVIGVYLARLSASIMYNTISNYAAVSTINNTSDSDRGLEFERQRHITRYGVVCFSSLAVVLNNNMEVIRERRNSERTVRTGLALEVRSAVLQGYSYISAFDRSVVALTNDRTRNGETVDNKVYTGYISASYLNRYACSCRIDVGAIKLKVCGCRILAIHNAHRPVAVLISLHAVCLIRIGVELEDYSCVGNGLAVLILYRTRNRLRVDVPTPNIARSNTRRIRLAIAVCILSGLVQQLSTGYRILNLDLVVISRDVFVRERAISDNGLLAYLLILAVKQGYNSAQHRAARVVDNIAAYSYIISNLYCIVGSIDVVSSLCVALGEFEAVSACVQTRNRILRATLYVSCYLDNLSSSVVQDTGIKACRLRTGDGVLAICLSYLRLVLLITYGYIVGCVDFAIAVHCDAVVARIIYLNGVIALCIGQRCGQQVEVVTGLLVQCNGSAFLCRATNGVVTRDCVVSQCGVIVIRITCGQILCLLVNSRNLYLISDTRCNGEVIGAILVGVSYINNVAVRVDDFNQSRSLLSVFIKNYTTDSGSIQTGYAIKILSCCGVSALFKIAIGDSEVQNTGSICAVREYTDIAASSQAINCPMTICVGSSISNQCVAVSAIDVNIYALYGVGCVNAVIGVVNVTIYYTRFRLRFRIRSRNYRISRVNRRYILVDLLYDILPLNICATYYEVELVSLCVGVIVSVSAAIVIKYDVYHVSAIRQLFKAVRSIGLSGSHSDILSTLLTINYLIQQYNAAFRHRSFGRCIGLVSLVIRLAGCGVAIQIAVSGRIAVDNDVSIVLVTQIKIYAYAASVSVITILISCTYSQETLRKVLQFVSAICISSSAAYSSISLGRLIIQISSYRNVRQFKLVAGVVQVIYRAAYIIIGVADSGARLILLREVVCLSIAIIQQCGQRVRENGNGVYIGFALVLMNKNIIPSVACIGCKRTILLFITQARDLDRLTIRLSVHEKLHVNVSAFDLIPALNQISILAVVLIMCLGLIVPNYLTSYRRGCRVMSKCDVKTRRIRGCIIAVRNVNKFYSVLNGLTIVVNVLFLPVDIPGAVGRTAGQSLWLASSLAVCVKLNLYGLRTLAITVCIVVPHDLSINGFGFLIASDCGFPLVLTSQVIQTAVALAPLSSGQVVPSIRLNSGAILGCGCLITFVEHCCCGCVIPAERVVNRNSSASGAPYRKVLDGASPGIALTSERYGTNLSAVAVNVNGSIGRAYCIVVIRISPIYSEIETNALSHCDCAVITVVGSVRGVLIHVCNFCSPDYRMTIKIGRQAGEGISPRVCIVLNCVRLSKVDSLILNTISQQLNIYAVGIRSIVPGVVVIHPAQIDCEVLLSLAYIVTVVLMSEVNIQAVVFTVHLVVPSSNAGGTSRSIVEDFVSYAIIDGVLFQSRNRISPARRTIAAPLGYFNSTYFNTGCISYLAGNAIQLVSAYYTLLCIGTHINGEIARAVSTLIISVKPVNMASFSACCSSLLQGHYNLVCLNVGFGQFDILRGYDLIIRCTKLRVQRYGCVVLDLVAVGGVNRKLRERPLHAVYIKVYSVLVVSTVNRHAISGQNQVQSFRAYTVRIVIVIKTERYAHVSLSRLVRQVQVHACSHSRIRLTCIIVQLNRIIDQLTILVLVKAGKVGNPNVRIFSVCIICSQSSSLAYYLFAVSVKLNFDGVRTLAVAVVVVIPVYLSRDALGLGTVRKVNLDVVRINGSRTLGGVGYFVAIRSSYLNRVNYRCASCALIIIVRCNILPGLSPIVIYVKLKSLAGCLTVSIKFTNDLCRANVIVVIVIQPVDVAGNITYGRRIVQMYVAAFHRNGVAISILKIISEVI